MATILTNQEVNFEEVIIKTLLKHKGKSRSIRDIKELLDNEYGKSLIYSKQAFFIAIEHLVHDGLVLDCMFYYLRMRIYSSFVGGEEEGGYEIRFFLFGNPCPNRNKSPKSVSVPTP